METKQNSGHMFFFFSTSVQKCRPKCTLLAYPQVIDCKISEIFFLLLAVDTVEARGSLVGEGPLCVWLSKWTQ